MDNPCITAYPGTLWSLTGESLLRLLGGETVVEVTAPPREPHTISATSRILQVDRLPDGRWHVLLSQR